MSRYPYDPLNPPGIGAIVSVHGYDEAIKTLAGRTVIHPAVIQRALECGYNHACWLLERMHERGLVGPMDQSNGRCAVLHPPAHAADGGAKEGA